jgi:type II secretory pathway component PulF
MKIVYKAVTKDAKIISGVVDAKDEGEVAQYLRMHEYHPIAINPEKEDFIRDFFVKGRRTRTTDIVFFTRQLSSMLASGLTLMQALSILHNQIQSPAMRDVVNGIITSVEEGGSFSNAISKYPKQFSSIYVSLIKAAEETGLLDKVLFRLADNLEKQAELRSTIKSALTYPAIVITLMILVMVVMLIFVIPNLSQFYDSLNVPLPLPTQILLGFSSLFTKWWYIMIVVIGLSGYYFQKWRKTETGKIRIDMILMRTPVFGKLVKESTITEFSRTFGLLVGTGTLVVDSLNKSADVVNLIPYKKAITAIAKQVEKGITIGDAMSFNPLFPPILVEMVKIGEQTGKLDESLGKVSEYFEREVATTVKALTTALEPFIMIILAIGVGFLILSIITPIYSLINQIQ